MEVLQIVERTLSYEDVNENGKGFVADPFLVSSEHTKWLFFEIYKQETGDQTIGYTKFPTGENPQVNEIELENDQFDYSFPFIFSFNGYNYMIPQLFTSEEDFPPLRVYRAQNFPHSWEFVDQYEVKGVDPVVFPFKGNWYLICSDRSDVNLYWADVPVKGSWKLHPSSPIKRSSTFQRMGGRPLISSDQIILFYQDCRWHYGEMVRCCEVLELSPNKFEQRDLQSLSPIVSGQYNGRWHHLGMHHIDIHFDEGIVVMDGQDNNGWSIGQGEVSDPLKPLTPQPRNFSFVQSINRYREILFDIKDKIAWKFHEFCGDFM